MNKKIEELKDDLVWICHEAKLTQENPSKTANTIFQKVQSLITSAVEEQKEKDALLIGDATDNGNLCQIIREQELV